MATVTELTEKGLADTGLIEWIVEVRNRSGHRLLFQMFAPDEGKARAWSASKAEARWANFQIDTRIETTRARIVCRQ